MSPFWQGWWAFVSGGRGEGFARAWGLLMGFAAGVLFSYFLGDAFR